MLLGTALLTGCEKFTILFPAGYVAEQQRDLLVASVVLMALVVIPLFVALIVIIYKYRDTNPKSSYAPEWEDSTKLELLIWAGPLVIVIALGAITWVGTHQLDPYSPLERIDDNQPLDPEKVDALQVDVVALRWKWLFLYPEYGIATVGKLAAPVDVPLKFRISAADIMNSFFIPTLAGQIYAMPGMQTQLIAVINEPGHYKGISANLNGLGFNHMDFDFIAMKKQKFQQWVEKVQSGDGNLTEERYRELSEPSIEIPRRYYANYADGIFRKVVLECFQPGGQCQPMWLSAAKMCGINYTSQYSQKVIE